jgi:hypothetical protein
MISKTTRRSRLAAMVAAAAMLVLAYQTVDAATVKFGAKLAAGQFPDNAYQGTLCDHEISGGVQTYACTWILMQAYNGGTVTAPKDGYINKVRIVNGVGGSFRFVIARKNSSGQFKVLRKSATIYYTKDNCPEPYNCSVHAYSISSLRISTGDYIGIQASKTSMLNCTSGGNRTALFTPTLAAGGSFTTPTDYSGCFLLLQAVYSN